MKSCHIIYAACSLYCIAGSVIAQQTDSPQFRKALTHEDLMKIQREQMAKGLDPMKNVTRVEGPDPSKQTAPESILKRSDFINANGLVTIVPKRAILFIPEAFKENVKDVEGAKLVPWGEFLMANRAWIDTYEVSSTLADGKEPIHEENWDRFKKSKKLVVATMMGGPISVLPVKEADTEKTEEIK